MSTPITVSGSVGDPSQGAFVYTTYDSNQNQYQLPHPNLGNQDQELSFMRYQGSVAYRKDAQGNVVVENYRPDGSLPV
jgi:hypothetical protein